MPDADNSARAAAERAGVDYDALPETVRAVFEDPETSVDACRDAIAEMTERDADRLHAVLEALLTAEDAYARRTAARIASVSANTHPDRAAALAPALVERIDDEYMLVREAASEALLRIGAERPEDVAGAADALPGLFDAEHPALSGLAVDLAATLAGERPDAVADAIPDLLAFAAEPVEPATGASESPSGTGNVPQRMRREESEQWATQRVQHRDRVSTVLVELARERPAAVADHLDALVSRLTPDGPPFAAGIAAETLGVVAERRPDPVREAALEPLAALATDGTVDGAVRAKATWALAVLGESAPEPVVDAVRPSLPTLFDLLDREDPHARAAVAGLLSQVSEREPEAVAPAREALLSLLDDDHVFVRGSAVWALAYLDDERARERLAAVADDDPDAEVREAAAAALAETD